MTHAAPKTRGERVIDWLFAPALGPVTGITIVTLGCVGVICGGLWPERQWWAIVLFALVGLYTLMADFRIRRATEEGYIAGFRAARAPSLHAAIVMTEQPDDGEGDASLSGQ